MSFQPPPVQTPFMTGKDISTPWLRWFQQISLVLSPGADVTGSAGGNAALESLLAILAAQGLISNKTMP